MKGVLDQTECERCERLKSINADLLTALKKLRADMNAECVVEGCTCCDGWQHDDPRLIAEIDATIAKATGSEATHGE